MINTHQQIRFAGASQAIFYDAPEGRPSSVTSVEVWEDVDDDSTTTETAVGAGSIDSVNTTFDAASGPAQSVRNKCNLAATTGVAIGRQYLLTNAYGQREWITAERIESGEAVWSQTELVHNYASSDTFQSTRMTATIDSTWVADTDNLSHPLCPRPKWRVAWTYVVSSVTYRAATWFDVVRYPFVTSVKPSDVDRLARNWLHRLPTNSRAGQGADVIDEAVYQVKLDLWEHNAADYALRNNALLNELIRRKAVSLLAEMHFHNGGARQDILNDARAEYTSRLEGLLERAQMQVTEDGAGGTIRRAPVWRR